jgi:hypothetical protein
MLVWFFVSNIFSTSSDDPTDDSSFSDRPSILSSSSQSPPNKSVKFHIVSVSPTTLSTKGNELIEIETNSSFKPPVFCRFGETVIVGRQTQSNQLICRCPRLHEGETLLAISLDRVKWSSAVALSVVSENSDLPWVIVTIGGFIVLAIALLVLRMLCGRRTVPKRRKAKRRKAGDTFLPSPELHHRRNPHNHL